MDVNTWAMTIALAHAERSKCSRRKVGCVLLDSNNRIIGNGYNGPPRGAVHCTETRCPGSGFGSGKSLDKCHAIHAEQNALMDCSDILQIQAVYCTTKPCIHCMKMIVNTSAKEVYYLEDYPTDETWDEIANLRPIKIERIELA